MNRTTLSLFASLLLGALAVAQKPLDLRIAVDREGLYEISWFDVAPFTDGRPLDTERLRLTRNGVEVPIAFRAVTGTRFDRPSKLQFYAFPGESSHSKRSIYRLEARPGIARIGERSVGPTERTLGEAWIVEKFAEDLVFDSMDTVQTRWLDLPTDERKSWFWARLATEGEDATKSVLLRMEPAPRPIDRSPATLVLRLRSNLGVDVEQSMSVTFAGQDLGERRWTDANLVELEFDVPSEILKSDNILTLKNTSKVKTWDDPGNQVRKTRLNDIYLDSAEIRLKTLLTGPTNREPQLIYDLSTPKSEGNVLLRFTNPGANSFRLYDVKRSAWLRNAEIDLPAGTDSRIVVCSPEGFRKPVEVAPWSSRNLAQERDGGDWVCITLERFAEFTPPLVEWREAQGLKPLVVTDREIYDAFSGGDFDPTAITRFLANGLEAWKHKPRFVLLIGDADLDVDWISERRVLPTALVPTYYNGLSASDRALMPDAQIAVGRMPARRADEVIRMVTRTVDYEKNAATGNWRRRLNFIASEGRFGPLVDKLIEGYASRVLTETIPAAYDVTMTYASASSSYLYPPAEFNAQVIRRFNEGALVFAYMGHGYAQGFDQLRVGDRRYPIFSRRDIEGINAETRSPLAVIIACSTAQFDQPSEDCVAEDLMRISGGPLALIGGTRITHPLANSFLSKELISRLFAAEMPTIGEALTAAQAAIVADWQKDPIANLAKPLVSGLDIDRLMQDHRHLYVLFGDPAARLALPAASIELTAADKVSAPGRLSLRGRLSETGPVRVALSLELRRDRLARPLPRVSSTDENYVGQVKANYEQANDKVLVTKVIEVEGGSFEAVIDLPEGLPIGPAILKAHALGKTGPMIGSIALTIRSGDEETQVAPDGPGER